MLSRSLILSLALTPIAWTEAKPNIILILADDLGYGDVSSYNAESKIQTPHIDSLAADGISFTDGHSNSAVCTPTRYGTLTGRYAWRSSLKKGVLFGYSPNLIEPDRITMASFLKKSGYNTACIGKWHLGMNFAKAEGGKWDYTKSIENGPNALGFDYFLGISASLDMPPYALIENDKFLQNPTANHPGGEKGKAGFTRPGAISPDFKHVDYLPDLAKKASSWISEQTKSDQPFFLYMPLPSPHKPVLPSAEFKGKSGIGDYGDYVVETDWAVGQVIETLKETGAYKNTLIIFTSDNGSFAVPDKYLVTQTGHKVNKHFRGQKTDLYEGGHRVPFIVSWPQGYASNKGKKSNQTISSIDLLATVKNVITPEETIHEDGVSFNAYLTGDLKAEDTLKLSTIHHSVSGAFAIRSGKWKLIESNSSGGRTKDTVATKGQLFNIQEDPSETTNLYQKHPEVVEKLSKILAEIRKED